MPINLMLGVRVEVRSNEDRYRGAWLEGVIVAAYAPRCGGRRYKIRYNHHSFEFLMDNGQQLKEEDVSFTQVRPIPPLPRRSLSDKQSYSVGDMVEVYDNNCWWLGTVVRVLQTANYFLIHNPHTGVYNKFYLSNIRDAQQWSKGRWSLLYSQQSSDSIYDGNCRVVENSRQTSVASSPGDMQTDGQSQEQPEEEVSKQRRQCGLIGTRVTLKPQECSNFLNAKKVVKDSRRSKFSNHGNGLKNIEALSQRRNSLLPPFKGVKRPYVHDDRGDGTFNGIQNGKCNNFKRFKHIDPAEAMEQRIQTHEMELLVYRSVLKALYAQNPSSLSLENQLLLTNLRIQLHITSDENTHELKSVTSQS